MLQRTKQFIRDWPLHIATVLLISVVLFIAPHQVGLIVYKGALLLGAAIGGYWVVRGMFGLRPAECSKEGQLIAAIVVGAAMIAAGLAA